MSSTKEHLSRADIVTILEEFLSRRLGQNKPNLSHFAINAHATVVAKLQNQSNFLGYDFGFIAEAVENLGNAEAVKTMDATAQLILSTTKQRKHNNTKTQDLLEQDDIVESTGE